MLVINIVECVLAIILTDCATTIHYKIKDDYPKTGKDYPMLRRASIIIAVLAGVISLIISIMEIINDPKNLVNWIMPCYYIVCVLLAFDWIEYWFDHWLSDWIEWLIFKQMMGFIVACLFAVLLPNCFTGF